MDWDYLWFYHWFFGDDDKKKSADAAEASFFEPLIIIVLAANGIRWLGRRALPFAKGITVMLTCKYLLSHPYVDNLLTRFFRYHINEGNPDLKYQEYSVNEIIHGVLYIAGFVLSILFFPVVLVEGVIVMLFAL